MTEAPEKTVCKAVALCIDEETCRYPELLGLADENLEKQNWLEIYSEANCAREGINANNELSEAWILSSKEIEPINLAASIKEDRPDLYVCLIAQETCGSLLSRAANANIDGVCTQSNFVKLYNSAKQHSLAYPQKRVVLPWDESCSNEVRAHSIDTKSSAIDKRNTFNIQDGIDIPRGANVLHEESCAEAQQNTRNSAYKQIDRPGSMFTGKSIPGHARKASLMTIVSGSGGAGKSSVAVLAANITQHKGLRTLLLDCDLQFGDVSSMIKSRECLDICTALDEPERLQDFIEQDLPIHVISRPARLESADEIGNRLPELLAQLMPFFDVIVANTGASWAEQHAVLLEQSTVALFLIDQRSSSLRACQHALELCERCGIASVPFKFALNKCTKNAPFNTIDVSCILQQTEVYELRDGGTEVEECLAGGAIEELMQSRNEFVLSLKCLMDAFFPNKEIKIPSETKTGKERKENARKRKRFFGNPWRR